VGKNAGTMAHYVSHLTLVQGIKQKLIHAKFCTENKFQKYGFQKKAMNFTTGKKIIEI